MSRFCTKEYQPPTPHNIKNPFMHLTNYSLNKKNEDYEFNIKASFDTGSKRTFSFVMDHLDKIGFNKEEVMEDIKYLIRMLMISLHPFLVFNFDC
jgi:hypothetical protein